MVNFNYGGIAEIEHCDSKFKHCFIRNILGVGYATNFSILWLDIVTQPLVGRGRREWYNHLYFIWVRIMKASFGSLNWPYPYIQL